MAAHFGVPGYVGVTERASGGCLQGVEPRIGRAGERWNGISYTVLVLRTGDLDL